jgi:hypothetical protein
MNILLLFLNKTDEINVIDVKKSAKCNCFFRAIVDRKTS